MGLGEASETPGKRGAAAQEVPTSYSVSHHPPSHVWRIPWSQRPAWTAGVLSPGQATGHPVLMSLPHPQVPMARASILWLIGEYCEHVPKIAPDVLRKMAKSFTTEEDIVKLQVINLAAKLYLTNSKQVKTE